MNSNLKDLKECAEKAFLSTWEHGETPVFQGSFDEFVSMKEDFLKTFEALLNQSELEYDEDY